MAGPELTSTRAPRVQAARRLVKRAFRERDRRFLAEGPQAVREAIATGATVHEIFATAEAATRQADLLDAARSADVPVHRVSGEVMSSIAQTVTPQGVVAVCDLLDVPLPDLLAHRPRLLVVLANVRDPGNAGTVIRTADAAGADGVVLTEASVDVYNGKCVRATAGSLFHLPVVTGVPVSLLVPAAQRAGLRVLATSGSAPTDLDEVTDTGALDGPTAWIFGNEAWGLPQDTVELADLAVRVPIHGRAESLNLATAAAVCLYASARAQRRG
jgi:TrmH family RNA methyltransferase